MEREYQICKRCVMDTTDPDIVFDEHGFCNHCTNALKRLNEVYFIDPEIKKKKLNEIVEKIKAEGKGKKYDCIIGLSGGVDSSYLAYVVVKELGLRPLAVHLDNGWNSELAVMNIDNIVNKLGIDLITYVINWEEFRDLQLSFLKSGVIDLEMLSDNAIVVSVYRGMKKFGINNFLIGSNIATESIMPSSWFYVPKFDSLNIRAINKNFAKRKIKTYPMLNIIEYIKYYYFKGHKSISILDYMQYDKSEALEVLESDFAYKPYTGKHYESRITQFYQSYILPCKYNVDKRKAHLSSLIISHQIKREEANLELKKPLFSTELEKENEIEYFCKKMRISREKLNEIVVSQPNSHFDYPSYYKFHKKMIDVKNKLIS